MAKLKLQIANYKKQFTNNSPYSSESGFTFIEIIITMGIMAIISSVSISFFYSTFSSYTKSNSILEMEENGDYALSIIEQRIRSAGRIVDYENASSCSSDCLSDWIVVKGTGSGGSCLYYGIYNDANPTLSGEPDIWAENGYVFQEEISCPATTGTLDGSPGADADPITNRNPQNPVNGINVVDLDFVIDDPAEAPGSTSIFLKMHQGVNGNQELPPENTRVSLTLETNVSLR